MQQDPWGNDINVDAPIPWNFLPRYTEDEKFQCSSTGASGFVKTFIRVNNGLNEVGIDIMTSIFPEDIKIGIDHLIAVVTDAPLFLAHIIGAIFYGAED